MKLEREGKRQENVNKRKTEIMKARRNDRKVETGENEKGSNLKKEKHNTKERGWGECRKKKK